MNIVVHAMGGDHLNAACLANLWKAMMMGSIPSLDQYLHVSFGKTGQVCFMIKEINARSLGADERKESEECPQHLRPVTASTQVVVVHCSMFPVASVPSTNSFSQESEEDGWEAWRNRAIAKLPGFEDQINEICSCIANALLNGSDNRNFPRGMLIKGSTGTGKTSLGLAITSTCGSLFYAESIQSLQIWENNHPDEALRLVFERAATNAPSLLFIDNIEALCGQYKRLNVLENRTSFQIVNMINQLPDNVFVIGATSRVESINPVLLQSRRLTRSIQLSALSFASRKKILEHMCKNVPGINLDELENVAVSTHGMKVADLVAISRSVTCQMLSLSSSPSSNSQMDVWKCMIDQHQPSSLRNRTTRIVDFSLEDIAGLDDVMQQLQVCVIDSFQKNNKYSRIGLSPPSGILLHGPSGCGKTCVAWGLRKAMKGKANFVYADAADILSSYVGDSEKQIRLLFEEARAVAPAIVFIDQIDALTPIRGNDSTTENTMDRILSCLLLELDGFKSRMHKHIYDTPVLFVAASSRPEMIDPALLRPGRLELKLHLAPPDINARQAILKKKIQKIKFDDSMQTIDDVAQQLAAKTEHFSGADLENLIREAAMEALRKDIHVPMVTLANIEDALRIIQGSLINEDDDTTTAPTTTAPPTTSEKTPFVFKV